MGDTPGFHKGRKLKKLGLKGQDTAELFFEDVRVPGSALLGKENGGFYQLMEQLPQERLIIAVCRAFIDQCLMLHTDGKLCGEMASMAKYWATDLENKVAADCLQLHCGWGFMWETNIAKAYADSRVQTIYGGTNEIMKELIARNIVKE